MAAESVKTYVDCRGCKTRWKIDAIWDPIVGKLVVWQHLRPCPLCGGCDCRVTYEAA